LATDWRNAAETALGSTLTDLQQLSGGDFAESYRAVLGGEARVFIKTHRDPPPGFFSTEGRGLQWLRASGTVPVPEVLAVSDAPPFLVLQWIEPLADSAGSTDKMRSDEQLGSALAKLHQGKFSVFGRPDERTTGSQKMPNQPCLDWVEFYAERRLIPLADLAAERRALSAADIKKLRLLARRLDRLDVPAEPPALLHGDLWAGNRVIDKDGNSWLIDPASHGGHREFDLAMMRLFGGFGESCFDAYQQVYPLQAGWEQRVSLHQLAPLVVHAIKFGGAYVAEVSTALEQYC